MSTTAAKERERGGGGGVGRTERAEEAWRRTDWNEAGNPRVSYLDPFGIQSHGPLGLGGPTAETLRTADGGWYRADTFPPFWRHSGMGCMATAGPLGLGLGTARPASPTCGVEPGAAGSGDGPWRAATARVPRGSDGVATTAGHLPMAASTADGAQACRRRSEPQKRSSPTFVPTARNPPRSHQKVAKGWRRRDGAPRRQLRRKRVRLLKLLADVRPTPSPDGIGLHLLT